MKQIMGQFAKIRKHRRISYLEIEKQTGIPFARMKKLESGEATITVDELEKLLKLYRMTYDQVRKYRRWNRLAMSMLAAFIAVALLVGGIYVWPDLYPMAQGSKDSGQATAQGANSVDGVERSDEPSGEVADDQSPQSFAGNDHLHNPIAVDDEEPTGGEPADSVRAASADPSSADSAANPEAVSSPMQDPVETVQSPADDPVETVVFRFWGNIPYHAEQLPQAREHEHARVIEIVPIQYLDDNHRPNWLQNKDREQFILNAGTTEVWTSTTKEGYEALQEEGYQVIGLGTSPDVYEPLILDVNGKKIGFLSLTGLIRNAEEIALPSRVGLPRAYRNDEVTEAVSKAKEKVDYLFVLIDWGRTYGRTPNTAQRLIGDAILKAGGDCVIGNRPEHAQDFIFVDGKPLFYALGHSVSESAKDGSYNLIVEAEFSTQLEQLSVIVGKLSDGTIHFDLTEDDKEHLQATYGDKEPLPDYMKMVW